MTPPDYEYWNAIGYTRADHCRGDRVLELLRSGRQHRLMDMARYQTDYLSIPGRELVPLLQGLTAGEARTEAARQQLLGWDYRLTPNSVAAAIYNQWERNLRELVTEQRIPQVARPYLSMQLRRVVEHLQLPDGRFGADPIRGRNEMLLQALQMTVAQFTDRLDTDTGNWQYGQTRYKHIVLEHPLSNAVDDRTRERLNVGPASRGGNDNQSSGASFGILIDTGNWDHCLGTNTPGKNGNPDHPHYRNLFDTGARDQYFPVFYSRKKVESVAEERWHLRPE